MDQYDLRLELADHLSKIFNIPAHTIEHILWQYMGSKGIQFSDKENETVEENSAFGVGS